MLLFIESWSSLPDWSKSSPLVSCLSCMPLALSESIHVEVYNVDWLLLWCPHTLDFLNFETPSSLWGEKSMNQSLKKKRWWCINISQRLSKRQTASKLMHLIVKLIRISFFINKIHVWFSNIFCFIPLCQNILISWNTNFLKIYTPN